MDNKKKTHRALISDVEAEILITHLETSTASQARAKAKAAGSSCLLTGLLKTPNGRSWEGSGKHYRIKAKDGKKGRYVLRKDIDKPILKQLSDDMISSNFMEAMLKEVKKCNDIKPPPELAETKKLLNDTNKRISRTMDLAADLDDPAPALRKVNELEKVRKAYADEITELEREHASQTALATITEENIKTVLQNIAEGLDEPKKEAIAAFVDYIELDSESLNCRICYRIPVADRVNMASPRGVEPLLPP